MLEQLVGGMLKNGYCPWFDRLTMRVKLLKTRDLILSLSKDEAKTSCFLSGLLGAQDRNLTRSLNRLALAPGDVRKSGAR